MCACSVVACQLVDQIHVSQQWLCNRLNIYLLSRFLLLLFFFFLTKTEQTALDVIEFVDGVSSIDSSWACSRK